LVLEESSSLSSSNLMDESSAGALVHFDTRSMPAARMPEGLSLPPEPGDDMPELAPPEPMIAIPDGKAPLLLDVTPQTLRIETVAGFTEVIIERNAAIPVEQSRMFSTSQDFQESVRARVCQGESRRLLENQELGQVELVGLQALPRGKSQIEVTFMMDADGTLQVRAKDMKTGTLQSIRINLVGAVQEDEIARMQRRQGALVG
jgi:molecular chaperone DnaK